MKPDIFDSIMLLQHIQSYSQNQQLPLPPLKATSTTVSIFFFTCFLSLDNDTQEKKIQTQKQQPFVDFYI